MTNPYQPGEPGAGDGDQPVPPPDGPPQEGQPDSPATAGSPTPPTPDQPRYGQYGPTGAAPASPAYPAASPYPGQTPYGEQPAYPGQQPAYPGQAPSYPGQTPYPGAGYQQAYGYPKNSLAVWSLVLGIVGFFICSFFTGIPAIIVGSRAKKAVRAGEANNGGMATAGIVIGWITVGLAILTIVAFTIIGATGNWSEFWDSYRDNANI